MMEESETSLLIKAYWKSLKVGVEVSHIPTDEMEADILTKDLSQETMDHCSTSVCDVHSNVLEGTDGDT